MGFEGRVVVVEPIGVGISFADEELAAVFVPGGALVFEINVILGEADDFNFSGGVRHGEAGAFAEAGGAGAGLLEYLVSFFDGYGVTFVAGSGSALENVIRRDADEGELAEEVGECVGGIVDVSDERGLIGEDGAGLVDDLAGLDGDVGEFVNVIEVDDGVKLLGLGAALPHQFEQVGIVEESLGIKGGDFRTDTDDADVSDLQERLDDFSEFVGGKYERVAAGEQDVGDFLVLPDIGKGGGQIFEDVFAGLQEDPFTEAVSADGAADVADEEQSGRVIFMFEAGENGEFVFFGGIEFAPFVEFVDVGDDEVPDGIVGIFPVDEG